jgi:HlyD family secretion protein
LHVEVDVDELDVGKLAAGQSALITLDALPSQAIPGQLTSIAPSANTNAGVVTYTARIDIAVADLPVRSGMTATADIIVQRLENVLLVPNWAVRFDRTTGQAYVNVLVDEKILKEVPVVLGMRGGTNSQVIAGLAEGQVVAVDLTEQTRDLFDGGGG